MEQISEHTMQSIMEALEHARVDAMLQHGPLTTDIVRACSILVRECGEAVNEALLATKPGISDMWASKHARDLYDELAQVATTAMLIMANLKGESGAKQQG